jgi:hypothetical protein
LPKSAKIIVELAVIVACWAMIVLTSLDWGMPNPGSAAVDAGFAVPTWKPIDMMAGNTYAYPPLQFLIWEAVAPASAMRPSDRGDYAQAFSERLLKFRLVVALMVLGSALMIYAGGRLLLHLEHYSPLPALLFLTNPMSVYYSHTTNMDQPYVFWWLASCVVFAAVNRRFENTTMPRLIAGNSAFGILMAASFCTKDHAYGLYLIPLFVFCGWHLRHRHLRARVVAAGAAWSLAFGLAVTGVYTAIGGIVPFQKHFVWITNEGSGSRFTEYGSGIAGRINLFFAGFIDLLIVVDWPMIACLIIASAILRKRLTSAAMRNAVLLTALVYLSYHVAYLQVIRFSFDRYYLAFVVFISFLLTLVLSHAGLANRFRERLLMAATLTLCAGPGIQVAIDLTHEPRAAAQALVAEMTAELPSQAQVALAGTSIDKVFFYTDEAFDHYMAVRDWSEGPFGVVAPQQFSIMLDPVYLSMTSPDIILTRTVAAAERALLEQFGYREVAHVSGAAGRWPSFYKRHFAPIYIFAHLQQSTAEKPLSTLRFEEALLAFSDCYNPRQKDRQLQAFGPVCPPFVLPDIIRYRLKPIHLESAAIAFALCGRSDDARKTFGFLEQTTDDPRIRDNARLFRERRRSQETPQKTP